MADVVVVFAEQFSAENHDALRSYLPDWQDGLIGTVASANRRAVVVLETCIPFCAATGRCRRDCVTA